MVSRQNSNKKFIFQWFRITKVFMMEEFQKHSQGSHKYLRWKALKQSLTIFSKFFILNVCGSRV